MHLLKNTYFSFRSPTGQFIHL